MAHILITGSATSSVKEYLVKHGHAYTVLQDEFKTKFPEKRFKHRVVTSFADKSAYLETVEVIHANHPIDATIAIYENYIVANAVISEHLGLHGISVDAAIACTDKEVMRTRFLEAPQKISPGFQVVNSENELRSFAENHTFPLILKPANLAKSLLVTKNDDLEMLLQNYQKALSLLETTYKKYAPNNSPKLLVEEFLEGSVHSVDAFVDADGVPNVLENVVDYQTGYDIGYDDNFHYSRLLPSRLDNATVQAIRECAAMGCKSLGMRSSPAHVEIILTKDGPRIVEIGARNGGYRERMHSTANGIDIMSNMLALALGDSLAISASSNYCIGVFELFPKESGLYYEIQNSDILQELPSFSYLSVKAKPGQTVGKSSDGYKMCAIVILHHKDAEQFERDRKYFEQNVKVVTISQL